AIAGDIAGGIEAGAAVALLLHQAQSHDGLETSDEDPALRQLVFVVERDLVERHRAGLCGSVPSRHNERQGLSAKRYKPSRGSSNAKKLSRLAISCRPPRRQGNVVPLATDEFWRTAAGGAGAPWRVPHARATSALSAVAAGPTSWRALQHADSVAARTPDRAPISGPEHASLWMPAPSTVRARPSRIDKRC